MPDARALHRHLSRACRFASGLLAAIAGVMAAPCPACAGEAKVDFNREVRPVLSEYCFACHGPDQEQRKRVKTDLRLDTRAGLAAKLDDIVPVVAGDPAHSAVYQRLCASDLDDRMPPEKTGKRPSAAQVATIKRWIEQGATWEQHWAFVPPARAAAPAVAEVGWPVNDIDRFVLARLEREVLRHAVAATRATLLRRVSLDLTGLPPTPAEVESFAADASPQAYERVVDRLLASPHYGERLAMAWLDGARYADSNGYQADHERAMWRWRDWVIDACNSNMPFDQFTVEQLAGDLLPSATDGQRIATGFNRNHRINTEGGIIPEEWLVETVIDRVDTTGQVWLGLTLGCARCHDHKYDPISQRDFYRLFAYYNRVPEPGMGKEVLAGTPPTMQAPTPEQRTRLATLVAAAVAAQRHAATFASPWQALPISAAKAGKDTRLTKQKDGSVLATKPAEHDTFTVQVTAPAGRLHALRIEALTDPGLPGMGPGTGGDGGFAISAISLAWAGPGGEQAVPITVASLDGVAPASGKEGQASAAWTLAKGGAAHQLVVTPVAPLDLPAGTTLTLTLGFAGKEARRLLGHFRLGFSPSAAFVAPPDQVAAEHELAAAEAARDAYDTALPTVMVMEDMPKPRPTWILQRGQYDKHGDAVEPGTPAAFAPLPPGAPANRLGLARWITDPGNPLTARVAVNRMWERLFGTGLVKSSDNFGAQGDLPSHPELLDWLAIEFVRLKWDMKAMVKIMVMSATYRQASVIDPAQAAADPENRLLAHGPRFRLQAETIRDQALAVAGLLTERVGGPSVRPYQPPGIWDELSNYGNLHNYQHATGPDLYQRSLYTIWKRTTPPPDMVLFDMPSREYCQVRRARTDTPLQALALLNDETFVEAARVLGGLMLGAGGTSSDTRLAYGFRRALARAPSDQELAILRAGFARRLARFRADPAAAQRLVAQGATPADPGQDPVELAAYATVASTILNLDETITKE